MKRKIQSKKSIRIKPHKFVTAIEKAGNKPASLKIIEGFIGKAARKDDIRIYLDAELRRFVDVSKKNIEHFEDQRTSSAPNASVIIWVKEYAKIRHFGNWAVNEDPTTMATGEEGGGDPTTLATGEEGAGIPNPYDEIVNPFGSF